MKQREYFQTSVISKTLYHTLKPMNFAFLFKNHVLILTHNS